MKNSMAMMHIHVTSRDFLICELNTTNVDYKGKDYKALASLLNEVLYKKKIKTVDDENFRYIFADDRCVLKLQEGKKEYYYSEYEIHSICFPGITHVCEDRYTTGSLVIHSDRPNGGSTIPYYGMQCVNISGMISFPDLLSVRGNILSISKADVIDMPLVQEVIDIRHIKCKTLNMPSLKKIFPDSFERAIIGRANFDTLETIDNKCFDDVRIEYFNAPALRRVAPDLQIGALEINCPALDEETKKRVFPHTVFKRAVPEMAINKLSLKEILSRSKGHEHE